VDLLHGAPGVPLRALFGPEHGIRGEVDEAVPDANDPKTGLPVHSLYGSRYQPTPEMLAGLDTLVFDIQDIGCRFYTYLSTLGHCLEAAAKHGLRFVVLDRPNPINGMAVEGPLADETRLSFTAFHPIPVRHGMTLGEMARLLNAERGWKADLVVVPCENWRRADWWDATGLTWVNPSPNMRSLTQATLYPGVGLLEFTNLSVGRGTDTPFEVLGAPYIDGRTFAAALNARNLPGVRFIPVRFTPNVRVFAGEECGGVNLLVTDRTKFAPVRTGLEIALALRTLYLEEWQASKYLTLLASRTTMDGLLAGEDYATLAKRFTPTCAPLFKPAPTSCCTSRLALRGLFLREPIVHAGDFGFEEGEVGERFAVGAEPPDAAALVEQVGGVKVPVLEVIVGAERFGGPAVRVGKQGAAQRVVGVGGQKGAVGFGLVPTDGGNIGVQRGQAVFSFPGRSVAPCSACTRRPGRRRGRGCGRARARAARACPSRRERKRWLGRERAASGRDRVWCGRRWGRATG
jgi:uncharacterized protein YbbC (DUF1343 family)